MTLGRLNGNLRQVPNLRILETLILQKLFARNFSSISFLTGKTNIIYLQLEKKKNLKENIERFRDSHIAQWTRHSLNTDNCHSSVSARYLHLCYELSMYDDSDDDSDNDCDMNFDIIPFITIRGKLARFTIYNMTVKEVPLKLS